MGWKKTRTKYCQVVDFINRVKRFSFECLAKIYGDYFDDVIAVDECTVELRSVTSKCWNKSKND